MAMMWADVHTETIAEAMQMAKEKMDYAKLRRALAKAKPLSSLLEGATDANRDWLAGKTLEQAVQGGSYGPPGIALLWVMTQQQERIHNLELVIEELSLRLSSLGG